MELEFAGWQSVEAEFGNRDRRVLRDKREDGAFDQELALDVGKRNTQVPLTSNAVLS